MKIGKMFSFVMLLAAPLCLVAAAETSNVGVCAIGSPCTIAYAGNAGEERLSEKSSESGGYVSTDYGGYTQIGLGDWDDLHVKPEANAIFKGWYGLSENTLHVQYATVSLCDTEYISRENIRKARTTGQLPVIFPKFVPLRLVETAVEPNGAGSVSYSPESDNQRYEEGSKVTLTANPANGYDFKCWKKGSSQVSIANPYTFPVGNADATYTAVFTGRVYTVTFDKNGGENDPEPKTMHVAYQGQYGTLPTCKSAGTFLGWFTEKSGGTEVTSTTTVTAIDDHALYAHWEKVTVTYKDASQFGWTVLKTDEVTYGGETVPPPSPVHDGWTFTGWDGLPADHKNIKQSITCTAKGDNNKYRVGYYSNGNKGSMGDNECTCWVDFQLPACTLVNAGFTFRGWDTNACASQVVYGDCQWVKNLAWSGEAKLYAVWEPIIYTIKYDANGGSGGYDSFETTYTNRFILPDGAALAMEDKGFGGWVLKTDATKPDFAGGATTTVKDCDASVTEQNELTFYAFWVTRKARFVPNAPNGNKVQVSPTEKPIVAGKEFGDLPTATCEGDWYTQCGWWTESVGGTEIASTNVVPEGEADITLYAHWTTNSYYIAFDGEGATGGEMSVQEFKFDTPAALTKNAYEKTGYTFNGWATNVGAAATLSDGAVVSNLLATTKNETNTLYAVWKGHDYKVRFYGNGGLGEMQLQAFTYGVAQNLSSNQFVREGYSFAGWATDPTNGVKFADGESVSDLTTDAGGKVALFAKWRSNMNVSELSVAADCDNLNLTTNAVGWTVEEYKPGEEKVGPNNQYLRTKVRSYLEAEISGPGVLTFQYKVLSIYGESFRAYYLDDTSRQNPILESSSVDTWQTCVWTNTVNEHGKKLQWLFSVNGPDPADYALLDNVRWTPGIAPTNWVGVTFRLNDGTPSPADVYYNKTCMSGQPIGTLPVLTDRSADLKFAGWSVSPEGGNLIDTSWIVPTFDVQLFAQWGQPQPTPDDRREITAMKVSADGLSFGFSNADSRWTYALRGTNELTATRPWPEVFSTNGATGAVRIDVPKPADEPSMFYYLEVR